MMPKEVDVLRALMSSMVKDLTSKLPPKSQTMDKQQGASSNGQPGASAQPAPPNANQTTPLNAANLEKQNQAMKHQRQGSKASQQPEQQQQQPPPAPTTSQPPAYPLGGMSPAGKPMYGGKPAVTQENLHLPARKKAKTGPQTSGGSGATNANSSPRLQKQPSPETAKRSAPADVKPLPKPQHQCPEKGCPSGTFGFASDEAMRAHYEEEHAKPMRDPIMFAKENLAALLDLDSEGRAKTAPKAVQTMANAASPAPAMALNLSKQGLTPSSRAETTPMSRSASMKQQPSSAGNQQAARNAVGKAGITKTVKGFGEDSKAGDSVQVSSVDVKQNVATVDPSTLCRIMGIPEPGGNGAISDMSVYRSISPHDTPESSKESYSSEPNSDLSEGIALNLTLDMGFDSWQPFDGEQSMMWNPEEPRVVDNDSMFAEFTSGWDDVQTDFDKPFAFDSSLYSMDTTS
jgi:hypothetical protein